MRGCRCGSRAAVEIVAVMSGQRDETDVASDAIGRRQRAAYWHWLSGGPGNTVARDNERDAEDRTHRALELCHAGDAVKLKKIASIRPLDLTDSIQTDCRGGRQFRFVVLRSLRRTFWRGADICPFENQKQKSLPCLPASAIASSDVKVAGPALFERQT
jgi:hypothetical protein